MNMLIQGSPGRGGRLPGLAQPAGRTERTHRGRGGATGLLGGPNPRQTDRLPPGDDVPSPAPAPRSPARSARGSLGLLTEGDEGVAEGGSAGSREGLPSNLGAKSFLPALSPCFTVEETEPGRLSPFWKVSVLGGRSAQQSRFCLLFFVFTTARHVDRTPGAEAAAPNAAKLGALPRSGTAHQAAGRGGGG